MHACRTIAVMREVVFAGPDKLDRSPDTARDLDGLMIKRHSKATAEASPHEGDVNGDLVFVYAEEFGGVLLGSSTCLGRGPYLAAVIFEPDRDVHRLHGGVGEERKLIDALDAFGGGNCVRVEGGIGGVPILLSIKSGA